MANVREVTSLPLARSFVDLLGAHGYRNVSDILSCQPFDLSQEMKITLEEALEIIRTAHQSTTSDISQTAKDLIQKQGENMIITFSRNIDRMLGGGVCIGQVTEICGVPGIGKTQLAMQLCVDVQVPSVFSGVEGHAVYIDTEGSFIPEREREIATVLHNHLTKIAKRSTTPEQSAAMSRSLSLISPDSLLKGIHVYRPLDATELMSVLTHLPGFLSQYTQIRLVVVDSIAFHYRQDISDRGTRNRSLSQISQLLQSIAHEYNVAVVLINHVTTHFDPVSGSSAIVPALGVFWHHCVTNRIMLSWKDNNRVASLVKSPSRPETSVIFTITSDGVRDMKKATVEGIKTANKSLISHYEVNSINNNNNNTSSIISNKRKANDLE